MLGKSLEAVTADVSVVKRGKRKNLPDVQLKGCCYRYVSQGQWNERQVRNVAAAIFSFLVHKKSHGFQLRTVVFSLALTKSAVFSQSTRMRERWVERAEGIGR